MTPTSATAEVNGNAAKGIQSRHNLKQIFVGVGCAFLANVIMVTNSIVVNRFKLLAAELCFLKALLQIAVFSTLYYFSLPKTINCCALTNDAPKSKGYLFVMSSTKDGPSLGQNNSCSLESYPQAAAAAASTAAAGEKPHETASLTVITKKRNLVFGDLDWSRFDWRLALTVCGCSLTFSIMTLTVYIGVSLLPVSDLVVLCHTSSVFTLLFSACILRLRITVLKAVLCLTALSGACMVVQPTFLFQNDVTSYDVTNKSDVIGNNMTTTTTEGSSNHNSDNYLLGVVMSLTCAVFAALSNVLSAKAKRCPLPLFMAVGGLGTLMVALLCPFLDLPNRFIMQQATPLLSSTPSSPLSSPSLAEQMPYVAGVTVGSLLGGLLIVYACQVVSPALVAVVRSSEILLALFADYVIFQTVQNPSLLHLVGSLLTLASVTLMAASDWIQEKLLDDFKCCRRCHKKVAPCCPVPDQNPSSEEAHNNNA